VVDSQAMTLSLSDKGFPWCRAQGKYHLAGTVCFLNPKLAAAAQAAFAWPKLLTGVVERPPASSTRQSVNQESHPQREGQALRDSKRRTTRVIGVRSLRRGGCGAARDAPTPRQY
jgi:hypothetical protein